MKCLPSLSLLLLLTGCAFTMPKYEGEITPITTPTSFEYSPAEGTLVTSANISVGNDSAFFRASTPYKVTRSFDKLSWNVKIDSLTVNKQNFKHKLPIVDATMTTTRKGEILNVDLSFPALSAIGKPVNKESNEYDEMLKSATNQCSQITEKAIVSGEVMVKSKNTNIRFAGTDNRSLDTVLAGYGKYKGKKVVVSTITAKDEHMILDNSRDELEFFGSVFGYAVNDASTMAIIRAEIGISGKTLKDGKPFTMSVNISE